MKRYKQLVREGTKTLALVLTAQKPKALHLRLSHKRLPLVLVPHGRLLKADGGELGGKLLNVLLERLDVGRGLQWGKSAAGLLGSEVGHRSWAEGLGMRGWA